jgi:hypothetical protein
MCSAYVHFCAGVGFEFRCAHRATSACQRVVVRLEIGLLTRRNISKIRTSFILGSVGLTCVACVVGAEATARERLRTSPPLAPLALLLAFLPLMFVLYVLPLYGTVWSLRFSAVRLYKACSRDGGAGFLSRVRERSGVLKAFRVCRLCGSCRESLDFRGRCRAFKPESARNQLLGKLARM